MFSTDLCQPDYQHTLRLSAVSVYILASVFTHCYEKHRPKKSGKIRERAIERVKNIGRERKIEDCTCMCAYGERQQKLGFLQLKQT